VKTTGTNQDSQAWRAVPCPLLARIGRTGSPLPAARPHTNVGVHGAAGPVILSLCILLLLGAATASAQTFTTLHNFTAESGSNDTNSDGATPQAGLISSGNNLYGTADYGGTGGNGTVFAVTTNGTGFTTLHSFTMSIYTASFGLPSSNPYSYTNSDGANPSLQLIVSGNTLYGAASVGGTGGSGTVFAVSTNGTGFTTLHSFTTVSGSHSTNGDGAYPYGAGLILSGGTLYGTTTAGGIGGKGTVFAVGANGAGFTTLHSFTAVSGSDDTNSDGAVPQAGLVLSGNTLYGTAFEGGTGGNGTVFAVNTNGTGFTNLYSFTALDTATDTTNSDGANPLQLILSGNTLYGTAEYGGNVGNGTVFSLSLPAPPAILGSATYADSPNFTLNTTGLASLVGGATYADSANFALNTTGLPTVIGGASFADSGNFILDTVTTVGGATYADSSNFTLNTTGLPSLVGGTTYADSADFILNTTGLPAVVGGTSFADSANFVLDTVTIVVGTTYADSANFTLNTTGLPDIVGGATFADSADFALNTTGLPTVIGGSSFADSGNFILDTATTIGGTTFADSANFALNTTGLPSLVGGATYADSADFILNTTGLPAVVGGTSFADSANFLLNTATTVGGATYADSANFTLNTSGLPSLVGGATYADSADFALNTTGLPAVIGGASFADSGNFILDTATTIGGTTFADSANFTLNTTGLPSLVGGATFADSTDFVLNTIATVGGTTYADSGDFILNTTGASSMVGGATYADSADFALNTTGISSIVGGASFADSASLVLNLTGLSTIVGGAAYADSANFALNTTLFSPTPILLTAAFYNLMDHNFQFKVTGQAGAQYIVQAASSLVSGDWIDLATNVGPFTFVDTNTNIVPQRFYRVLLQP
jgi:uncharacterized repeat protein (TIGR03803 family)